MNPLISHRQGSRPPPAPAAWTAAPSGATAEPGTPAARAAPALPSKILMRPWASLTEIHLRCHSMTAASDPPEPHGWQNRRHVLVTCDRSDSMTSRVDSPETSTLNFFLGAKSFFSLAIYERRRRSKQVATAQRPPRSPQCQCTRRRARSSCPPGWKTAPRPPPRWRFPAAAAWTPPSPAGHGSPPRPATPRQHSSWLRFPYISVHFVFGSYHDDKKTET
jgi:hypothetical protein